jgi:hypothetical protein
MSPINLLLLPYLTLYLEANYSACLIKETPRACMIVSKRDAVFIKISLNSGIPLVTS